MDRVEALLRHINGTPTPKRRITLPCGVCVDDGFFVDPSTGRVLGRCIELSQNENNHFLPIYYYNRSWRFVSLFTQYNIRLVDQGVTLQMFERLEQVWEKVKSNYERVYFLTQKLLLQEITKRLGIPSTQPTRRPISDLKRYCRQLQIFNDLYDLSTFCIS